MALTDITFKEGASELANRGSIGTLVDITFKPRLASYIFRTEPAVANVVSGVTYGSQGTQLTGTFAPTSGATDYAF